MLVLKNLLFTLVVPGAVAAYVPWFLTRSQSSLSGAPRVIAAALFVVGGAIYAWCVWDFAAFGHGTPLPLDAPQRLVVRGLYRHTRNPMYLGVLALVFAWSTLYDSLLLFGYTLCVAVCFQLFITLYEEPHLRQAFGQEYTDYCAQVPRWLPRGR